MAIIRGKQLFVEKRPKGWMTTVLMVLLLLAIAVVLYFMVKGRREGFADADKTTITVFLMEGCPYCDKFKPEWEKLQKMVTEQGLPIRPVTVDASDKVTTNKYGVTGFPTIVVEKGAKKETYDGQRTADALLAFATGL